MKKTNLILILTFLLTTTIFAQEKQEESIKNKNEINLDIPLEDDRYSKYKQEKYSPPPTIAETEKLKEKDIEIGGEVEVDKVTREVEKLKLDISKKF